MIFEKWTNMVKNGQNGEIWSKIVKMAQMPDKWQKERKAEQSLQAVWYGSRQEVVENTVRRNFFLRAFESVSCPRLTVWYLLLTPDRFGPDCMLAQLSVVWSYLYHRNDMWRGQIGSAWYVFAHLVRTTSSFELEGYIMYQMNCTNVATFFFVFWKP